MLSPPITPPPSLATMPATKTWLPTTRQLDHVCGGGSGTCGLEIFFFIGSPWMAALIVGASSELNSVLGSEDMGSWADYERGFGRGQWPARRGEVVAKSPSAL